MPTVRCTIEMDMVEGKDFINLGEEEDAYFWAGLSFIERVFALIKNEDNELLYEYLQTKIVEEKS